ncbi:rhodanese-like domain-containing protein [Haloferula sp.]|uniref:rhodanese-like domain-containing protein n=1 Tax=Haloferula sp. TaxID=2497595 RepID=UPI00329EAA11
MDPAKLSIASPMGEIMDSLPGARRALFSRYHLGGCQSCGFEPTETLAELAARAAEAPAEEMLEHILAAHQHDKAMLVEPSDAKASLDSENPPLLLDTRTREEHDAVAIPGSEFMDQDYQQRLFAGDPERAILLYDHTGKHVLDTCSWFQGHGMKNTRAISGGIDAWSQQVDPTLRRYRLEID